ncbi:hypothetical protein [Leyella stercorea]
MSLNDGACRYVYLRRKKLLIASASTVTSIRVGRYEHPRRSLRASASTVTSICVGRYEHPRRSTRMINL